MKTYCACNKICMLLYYKLIIIILRVFKLIDIYRNPTNMNNVLVHRVLVYYQGMLQI